MSWRMTLDTYEPEIARYGGPEGIALVERWFCADSEAAAEALESQHRARADQDQRRRLALAAVDAALHQLTPERDTRLATIRAARERLDGLGREIPDPRELPRPSLDARYESRYRAERPALEAALAAARNGSHASPAGIEAFRIRAPEFERIAAELHELDRRLALTTTLREITLSLIHMRVNRVPPAAKVATNLEPELRLYDALERLYTSELAR